MGFCERTAVPAGGSTLLSNLSFWDWVPLQSQGPTLLARLLEPQRTSHLPHTGSRGLESAPEREEMRTGPMQATAWAWDTQYGLRGGPQQVPGVIREGHPSRRARHSLGLGAWNQPQVAASLIHGLHCLFSVLAHCIFDHGDEIHSLHCNWRYAKWLSHSLSHSELVVGPQSWSPGQWPFTLSHHVASISFSLAPSPQHSIPLSVPWCNGLKVCISPLCIPEVLNPQCCWFQRWDL